jgi:indole-3-glycerol phosphate synthase
MDFLANIVKAKIAENLRLFEAGAVAEFKRAIATRPEPRSLKAALDERRPAILAEIKRASPSKGELAMVWDPVELGRLYEANGAAALSVLTETQYFKGHPDFIRKLRPVVSLPILRKDFILEPIQVYESAALFADALLLIVSLLEEEMATALAVGARLIGINSRNLHTFEMFPERALELAPLAPPGVTLVAASGIKAPVDLKRYEAAGIHAFLVGETLVTAADPGAKLREFVKGN